MSRSCRAKPEWEIPDELFARLLPLLPPQKQAGTAGRPPVPWRAVLNAIFHVLRTGSHWKAPNPHCPGSTAHRGFQTLVREGALRRMWEAGLLAYDELAGIAWDWQSVDGAMTKAPLGGENDGPQSHRPRQVRHQAPPARGRARRAPGHRRQRREHA